jgi:hypothetical protein
MVLKQKYLNYCLQSKGHSRRHASLRYERRFFLVVGGGGPLLICKEGGRKHKSVTKNAYCLADNPKME